LSEEAREAGHEPVSAGSRCVSRLDAPLAWLREQYDLGEKQASRISNARRDSYESDSPLPP
jgi:hypothetical protein